MMSWRVVGPLVAVAILAAWVALVPTAGATTVASLSPSAAASGQPVGTSITWTTHASGSGSLEYQYSVTAPGQTPSVVRDFEANPSFTWTPLEEGTYTISVAVQPAGSGGQAATASATYAIVSRATSAPVLTPTANPLVVLYSGAPCSVAMTSVSFGVQGTPSSVWLKTDAQPCHPGQTNNWYIAGLRAHTTYALQQSFVNNSGGVVFGPLLSYTTGAVPSSVVLPTFSLPHPAGPAASFADGVVLFNNQVLQPDTPFAVATGLGGQVIWYYDPSHYSDVNPVASIVRPLEGGRVLMVVGAVRGGSGQQIPARDRPRRQHAARDGPGAHQRAAGRPRRADRLEPAPRSDAAAQWPHPHARPRRAADVQRPGRLGPGGHLVRRDH